MLYPLSYGGYGFKRRAPATLGGDSGRRVR